MKNLLFTLTTALVVALLGATGCSKKVELDPAPFQQTFAEADDALKAGAAEVVKLIEAEDYAGAVEKLQAMYDGGELDPMQEMEAMTLMDDLKPLTE